MADMYNVGIKKEGTQAPEAVEEVYPKVSISSDRVKDLKDKNLNETFSAQVTFVVKGIREEEVKLDVYEDVYDLEVKEMGITDKEPEDMSSDELQDSILKKIK